MHLSSKTILPLIGIANSTTWLGNSSIFARILIKNRIGFQTKIHEFFEFKTNETIKKLICLPNSKCSTLGDFFPIANYLANLYPIICSLIHTTLKNFTSQNIKRKKCMQIKILHF